MRIHERYILLALTALTVISVGCSTSRQDLADRDSASSAITQVQDAQLLNAVSAPEPGDTTSAVQTGAYLDNELDGRSNDNSDAPVRLAVSVGIESVAMRESGLTLEAIEQLALANNPAIQQASAASARAGGIRTQVGLKPNPTIGYFGDRQRRGRGTSRCLRLSDICSRRQAGVEQTGDWPRCQRHELAD